MAEHMSVFDRMAACRAARTGSSTAKAVLMTLCQYCGPDGYCWPSVPTIARDTELSRRCVQMALRSLEDGGIIASERRTVEVDGVERQTSNGYRIRVSPAQQMHGGGAPVARGGAHQLRGGGAPDAPEVSKGTVQMEEDKDTPHSPPKGGDPAKAAKPKKPPGGERFAEFWQAYPRKVGKQAAARAFEKATKAGTDPEAIVAAGTAYGAATALWDKADQQFIPHPSTWLNQGRWDDDPNTWSRTDGSVSGGNRAAASGTGGAKPRRTGVTENGNIEGTYDQRIDLRPHTIRFTADGRMAPPR